MKAFISALFFSSKKGFTLIELLVVIAVMGVLATVVLVAVDPVEQFARARDGNRKQIVNTLGNSLIQYYTLRQQLPAEGATWIDSLVSSGELKTAPDNAPLTCGGASAGSDNNYCYNTNTGVPLTAVDAVVWVALESKADAITAGNGTACTGVTPRAYFVFNTSTAKTCYACGSATQIYETATACP